MGMATTGNAIDFQIPLVQNHLLQAERDRVASDFAGLDLAGWECGAIVELHFARRTPSAGFDDADLKIV